MLVYHAQPRSDEARQTAIRVQVLLVEALHLIDQLGGAQEIGARVQDVIDRLAESNHALPQQ